MVWWSSGVVSHLPSVRTRGGANKGPVFAPASGLFFLLELSQTGLEPGDGSV